MRWHGSLAFIACLVFAGCARSPTAETEVIPHPDKRGAVVEYYVKKPVGVGPWPTVIFLHGHQNGPSRPGGKAYVTWGVLDDFAKQGYLAISISLPGYGGSSGPEDFAGPLAQDAVEAVIARIKTDHLAAPDKIAIEGVSLGAVTGALVAAHDPRIKGLVLISGLYDLPAFLAHPKSTAAKGVKAVLDRQTGGTDGALRERSALLVAGNIRAATLIINGGHDDRTDADQARQLAASINAHGGHATAHIYPEYGHDIPVKVREPEIDQFIAAALGVKH